jgi:hypothetical protein
MQDAVIAADLHVDRRIGVKAMFPLHVEAQEFDVEFACLGNVEDAQDGRDTAKLRHGGASVHERFGKVEAGGDPYFSSSSRSR